jgi:hypothetical protein
MFKRTINKTAGGSMAIVWILQALVCLVWTLGMYWQAFQIAADGKWLIAALVAFVIVPIVGAIIYTVVGLVGALLMAPFALIARLTEPKDEVA